MPSFADPWLLALLPAPLLALRLLAPAASVAGALAAPASVLAAAAPSPAAAAGASRRLRLAAPWLAWVALVVALAGPQSATLAVAIPPAGRDVILAVDLSGSMERDDFTLDGRPAARIDVVRRLAAAFVRGRTGDRVGLVVFGDKAYVAAAPSFDVEAVAQAVESMAIGVAGRSTAISDGLGLSLKRLAASEAPSRVIVLLSDGTNTAGDVDPQDAAALAAELGVRVHTIALGPKAVSEGNLDRNAVDDVMLARIARASGGVAFRVRDQADFAAVDAEIDRLEASPTDAPATPVRRPLWMWPAALACLAGFAMAVGRG